MQHTDNTCNIGAALNPRERRFRGSLFARLADYADLVEQGGARRAFQRRQVDALRQVAVDAWYPPPRFRNSARSLFQESDAGPGAESVRFAAWLAERDVHAVAGLSESGPAGVLAMLPHLYARHADGGAPRVRTLGEGYAQVEFESAPSMEHDRADRLVCAAVRAWLGGALAAAGAERIRTRATCERSVAVTWYEPGAGLRCFLGTPSEPPADPGPFELVRDELAPTHVVFTEPEGATVLLERVAREPASGSPTSDMTPSERDVLEGLLAGATDAEIAARRSSSTRTVSNQVRSIFTKLGVRSRRELWARFGAR